jgi:hypothetical protein
VPPVPASPNIGDIVTSTLSEPQFLSIHGAGWVLADGREVPGTKYASSVSPKVPDLRGMFLRGINAGRSDQYADPDGDRTAGSIQSESTALPKAGFTTTHAGTHNHAGRFVGNGAGAHQPGPSGGPAYDSQPIIPDGDHTHTVIGGDAETRPRNIAVYFYIRVQ